MTKKQDTEYKYWCKFQEENCSYCWGTVFNSTPQEFKNKYNAVCYIEDVDKAVGVGVFLRTLGYKIQKGDVPDALKGWSIIKINISSPIQVLVPLQGF